MHSEPETVKSGTPRRNVPKWYDDEYDEYGNLIIRVIETEDNKNARLKEKRLAEAEAKKIRDYDTWFAAQPGDPGYDPTVIEKIDPKYLAEDIGLERKKNRTPEQIDFDQVPLHFNEEGDYEPAITHGM